MQNDFGKYGKVTGMLRLIAACALVFFSTCAYSASKTILVLGDSLSAEYGIARGSGWVALLEKRMKAEKVDAGIVNASISGETSSGGMVRLPALLMQHRPSVVVIELGANDGLRGLSLTSAEENLRTMITASRKANAKVLLLGTKIPSNYGRDYTEKFAAMFEKLGKETRVPVVPFLLEGVANQPQLFQADRLHPSAEAQPVMLNNIWPQLKPLLTK